MANQHTPEPKFLPPFNNIFEGVDIAKCLTQTIEEDQVLKQARARLNSAAPELLAALQSLIQYLPEEEIYYEDASAYRQIQSAVQRAEAAIANATNP